MHKTEYAGGTHPRTLKVGLGGEGHLLCKQKDLTLDPITHIKMGVALRMLTMSMAGRRKEKGGLLRLLAGIFLRTLSLDRHKETPTSLSSRGTRL